MATQVDATTPAPEAKPGLWARPWAKPLALFVAVWALYLASGSYRVTYYNAHVYLANSFLHGHLDIPNPPKHFELVPFEDKFFINYGVAAAVLMMPLALIWGTDVHQAAFCAFLGAAAVTFWWLSLKRMALPASLRRWMVAAFAIGSPFWFDAGRNGWTWPMMHVVVLFGLMMALAEALGKRRGWLVGLGLAIAISSRQLTLFSCPFYLYLLVRPREEAYEELSVLLRRAGEFSAVVVACLGLNALYNFFRFHSFTDNGYARFIAKDHPVWGIFSVHYFWDRVGNYFTSWPKIQNLQVGDRLLPIPTMTMDGPNLWLSFPAVVLAFFADYRKFINLAALATLLIGFCPYLIYYWSGWVQFGCRYFMDVMPLALILIIDGVRRHSWGLKALKVAVVLGVLVEVWGMTWWAYQGWG